MRVRAPRKPKTGISYYIQFQVHSSYSYLHKQMLVYLLQSKSRYWLFGLKKSVHHMSVSWREWGSGYLLPVSSPRILAWRICIRTVFFHISVNIEYPRWEKMPQRIYITFTNSNIKKISTADHIRIYLHKDNMSKRSTAIYSQEVDADTL